MRAFWITPHAPRGAAIEPPFCVMARDEAEARIIAEVESVASFTINTLPYAASPQRGPHYEPVTLCRSPRECQGWRFCPRSYTCSE